MKQLHAHRQTCELQGRYAEASAADTRVKQLQAQEGARLRAVLASAQQRELAFLQAAFERDSAAADDAARASAAEYEAAVACQLAALTQRHEAQLTELLLRCEAARPSRPHHSSSILNSRRIEEALIKQGQYRRAHGVKVSADALHSAGVAAAHQAWELGLELKRGKLAAKQQTEAEAFLARAAQGRNELELRRLDAAKQRHHRFRAQLQELDAMHRLETQQLGGYLGSAQACLLVPYAPLRDTKLRRKRELLGL